MANGEEWKDLVTVEDLLALDMEYRLTIAGRMILNDKACDCSPYFINRREVLIPQILKQSVIQGRDAVELFHEFQKKVHARHAEEDSDG